jgi:hypothetical protein
MHEHISPGRTITPAVRRRILKWLGKAAMGLVVYGLMLFLAAGTWRWLWGWLFLGVLAAHLAAHPLLLVPLNPELLAEREKGFLEKEVKVWDKRLTSVAGGAMVFSWLVAGLDSRWQWTGPIPLGYHLWGLLLTILGYTLLP